jgi:hypothetical protein
MTQEENGNIENIKTNLDIEIDNDNAKLEGFLGDARTYFDEQLQTASLPVLTNPTKRQKHLMEEYAEGLYILKVRPEHSSKLYEIARSDIRTHVRSLLQNRTEDDVATGSNQFKKTAGNTGTKI